jgi:hypothetical protein
MYVVPRAAIIRIESLRRSVVGNDKVMIDAVHLGLVARFAVLDIREVRRSIPRIPALAATAGLRPRSQQHGRFPYMAP